MSKKPAVVKDIEANAEFRKKRKREIDEAINLSNISHKKERTFLMARQDSQGRYRLLDEGSILFGDGSVRLYLCKGTIQSFYDNLSNDYVGSINIGHESFHSDPRIVGTWTKEDLHVVDIGDGRKALDVDLHLNEELYAVKDLRTQGNPIGLSAEFYQELDWEKTFNLGFPVVTKIDIKDFAIVGDYGNANSGGIYLSNEKKEDKPLKKKEKNPVQKAMEKFFNMMSEELENEEKDPVEDPVEDPIEDDLEAKEKDPVEDPKGEDKLKNTVTNIEKLTKEHKEYGEAVIALTAKVEELQAKVKEYENAFDAIGKNFEKLGTLEVSTDTQELDDPWGNYE